MRLIDADALLEEASELSIDDCMLIMAIVKKQPTVHNISESYNKAIDDFKKIMELWASNIEEIRHRQAFFTIQDIRYQAEQLKAGGADGK